MRFIKISKVTKAQWVILEAKCGDYTRIFWENLPLCIKLYRLVLKLLKILTLTHGNNDTPRSKTQDFTPMVLKYLVDVHFLSIGSLYRKVWAFRKWFYLFHALSVAFL